MAVLALAVLLTVGSDVSLTTPSEEAIKGAWRLGRTCQNDPPVFISESNKRPARSRHYDMDRVLVEWQTPLREAFKRGQEFTLTEDKYEFKPLFNDIQALSHRLSFDITLRVFPDSGDSAPTASRAETIGEASISLLLGGKRFYPLTEPRIPTVWKSGKISSTSLVTFGEWGRDAAGLYVKPSSEFRSRWHPYYYSEGKIRVEFDPARTFDISLDKLTDQEFVVEVELGQERHKAKFTPKGREDFLSQVAKNVQKPTR